MPNGFQGPKEEWDRMEAPLLEIDQQLRLFAQANRMEYSSNYHSWPERSLEWHKNRVIRTIQIYLQDEKKLTFNIWLCAYQARMGRRWKNTYLIKDASFDVIRDNLRQLLGDGVKILEAWDESTLELIPDPK
ncbi:MAG: hypothetical protein HY259_13055 [Chloroflexi bacterium]|nr:hypothetical protein [Chloroflexota bacterium]MBI3734365.1 hypothetical protein [Chloroflexota bacterium]